MPAQPDLSQHITDFRGQPTVALKAPDGSTAVIALHGATLLSWVPAGGKERLYLSDTAVFDGRAPIRGGVPVIFPQFGARGPLPRHGFARNRPWSLVTWREGSDFALATLRLESDTETKAVFPHDFALELTVMVSAGRLDIELEVHNTGGDALSFSGALHTYLRVADVETIELDGLQSRRYLDAVKGDEKKDLANELIVEDEVDRVYFGARGALLREPHRALLVQSDGFPDLVVWNPWEDKCATIADLPRDGFRRFLCVESAVVEHPVTLEAGAEWVGRQTLSLA